MNAKQIISKTITFVVIVIAIILFKGIFGDENLLIGVMSIALMLMLLERDLTMHPVKHTLQLVGVNLVMGLAAFVAASNLWLAIPINLVFIFVLGHGLLYDLRKPIYVPFVLEYLFILFTPITVNQLPMRLLALVVGALSIMLVQLLVNKNKLAQSGDKLLEKIIQNLMRKIECMRNGQADSSKEEMPVLLRELRKMISDRRKDELYLTEEARIKLNLSVALERIYFGLDKIEDTLIQQECMEDVYRLLAMIKDVLQNKTQIEQIDPVTEYLKNKYNKEYIFDLVAVEMGQDLVFLNEALKELKILDKDKYSLVKDAEETARRYKWIFRKKYMRVDTVKFSFGIRLAFGITLTTFITQYFQLPQGKWMVFTVLALVIPVYEVSKQKSKDRLFATITGCILAIVLFSIFTDTLAKVVIMLLVGYVNMYFTRYRYTCMLYTTLAVGGASMAGGLELLTINRIFFVIAGAIIAMLINRLVLHYKLQDNNNYLIEMYQGIIGEMKRESELIKEGQNDKHSIRNLFVMASMIEDRLLMNNQILEDKQIEARLDESRIIMSNVYQ